MRTRHSDWPHHGPYQGLSGLELAPFPVTFSSLSFPFPIGGVPLSPNLNVLLLHPNKLAPVFIHSSSQRPPPAESEGEYH